MTATSGAHAPGSGPLNRVLMLLGHYVTPLDPAVTALLFATVGVKLWVPVLATPAAVTTMILAAVSVFSSTFAEGFHGRNLCLRCIQDAPLLDPQGAVDTHMKHLRRYHFRNRWVVLLYSVPLLIVLMTPVTAPFWLKLLVSVAGAAVLPVLLSNINSNSIHHRIRAYCPWCHPRRGGDDDRTPHPTPAPSGSVN